MDSIQDMEDTDRNTLPDVKPPEMRFQYGDLFESDDDPTLEEIRINGPDTVDEIRGDVYERLLSDELNEAEKLNEDDMEPLPPDTVENAPVFTQETEMFYRFLIDNKLMGRNRKNHVGISLEDGAKFDVILRGKNEVRFECDIPIEVDGEITGVRCFDMQFSDLTGECIRFSWHDFCFHETGTRKKAEFEKVASELPALEWREVLKKFSDAFNNGN